VVEVLRAGWRSGQEGRGWMSPKVQAVLGSRLAQLPGPARDLVGVAATIGRAFTTEVLAGASEATEEALVRGLDELWRRRIVREQGSDAYDFTHDKLREVAYRALSPARRRRTHLLVARALERLHADDPAPVAAQLAAHHERGGALDQAVAWYERAAEAAQQLPANAEAVGLLDRALRLLDLLPPTPARRARKLALLTALPAPLGAVEGYASSRLAQVQRRGLELAGALGVEPEPPLLRSQAIASLSRGDFDDAQRVGARLRSGGERDADDVRVVEGHYVLGIAAFWEGEFATARHHFEAAVDRYRAEHRPTHLVRYGLDPKVVCWSRLGNTLWFLGRPEAASRARRGALTLADEIGHPSTRATALIFAALLALELRDPGAVREYAAALEATHGEQMRPTRVGADALGGYVDVLDGREAAGIARIRRALDGPGEADHAPGLQASITRLLLEACVVAGDARAGLVAVDRALEGGDHVRTWESEIRRLRAEFLARLGASRDEVEAELERALRVAGRQGAKMLELRAATSLLRHRRRGGGGPGAGRARDRLAAIVDGLPDAGSSQELREATAILAGG
jgi:tetratricopeptide (TPR) repeat protein